MSSAPQNALPPFGWYPDPTGLPMYRWWTGSAWTEQLEAPRPEIQPVTGAFNDGHSQSNLLAS